MDQNIPDMITFLDSNEDETTKYNELKKMAQTILKQKHIHDVHALQRYSEGFDETPLLFRIQRQNHDERIFPLLSLSIRMAG